MSPNIENSLIEAIDNNRRVLAKDRVTSVFLLGNGLVAKGYEHSEEAEKEYSFGVFAYNNGISVPRMHSLEHKNIGGYNFFIIMERILGKNLEDIRGEQFRRALELQVAELRRVFELGVSPTDSIQYHSAIYVKEPDRLFLEHPKVSNKAKRLFDNPAQDKIVLVDLALWSRDKRELEAEREFLEKYYNAAKRNKGHGNLLVLTR